MLGVNCRKMTKAPHVTPTHWIPNPVRCHMTNLNVIYHQFLPTIVVDPESYVSIKLRAIISMTCLAVLHDSLNIKESLISSNPAC